MDADTANGDEIFFSKVSQTPVSSRTRCPRRAVTDSVILITCRPSAAMRTCECTWVDACGLPALLPARLPACQCAPAVLGALTLLRRLSNQSASEPPASSPPIGRAAGRCEGCETDAEETVGGSAGKWAEEDEQQREEDWAYFEVFIIIIIIIIIKDCL